jgi:Peptidase family S41
MKLPLLAAVVFAALLQPVQAADDGAVLQAQILKTYPSLLYVERYRQSFPDEVQGKTPFWLAAAPRIAQPGDLVAALAQLADQHVALVGPRAGKSETLGALFRTASDNSMIVWRVFEPGGLREGDQVLAIDGLPTPDWLKRAAAVTFGGNRRGRIAEAATELGLGTPIVHRTAGLGNTVSLRVQAAGGAVHTVKLAFLPMTQERAGAMTAAIGRSDLPEAFTAHGMRAGTLRIGAFAPQYDPVFLAASDRAAKKPGTTDDQAMLAGYCAIVASFITRYDAVAKRSDVIVIDLRGNLGGFDREARLIADALLPSPPTFDLFAGAKRGTVRLAEETRDPSCGHVAARRPIMVLDDAATRSGGEFLATWLWASGTTIAGEQTVGAGGGFESDAQGFALPVSGLAVRTSGNFTVFDPTNTLHDGDWPQAALIAKITSDRFHPSRSRPFAIQSVGITPDLPLTTKLADLRDGGIGQIARAVAGMRTHHLLQ